MTPEQITAVLTGLAALVIAVGALLHNIAELRRDVNGRLSELLDERAAAARKEGELAGRDFAVARRRRDDNASESLHNDP